MAGRYRTLIWGLIIVYTLLVLLLLGLLYFTIRQIPSYVFLLFLFVLLSIPYYILVGIGKSARYVPISHIIKDYFKAESTRSGQ